MADTKMKKETIKIVVAIVLGILVVVGIFFISENVGDRSNDKAPTTSNESYANDGTNPLLDEGEVLNEEEQKELVSMSLDELKSAIDNNEKKFVMVGREGCGWCQYQKPLLKSVSYKYNLDIYYFNTDDLTTDDAWQEFRSLHDDLTSFGTPAFLIVNDGKIEKVDKTGARGTDAIVQLLQENGFVD